MPDPDHIRNIGIIAHIDHGKTTLTNALLYQSGVLSDRGAMVDRVMDSMDQERERGITILAKNATITWQDITFNIIDTPGHADFGGEVERGLTMVDGVVLLVDASEGPLPQTRFVLRKALAQHLPIILVINKVDRPDARINEVVDETFALFIDLDADDEQIDFPILYSNAKAGWASRESDQVGVDMQPLLETIVKVIPAPGGDPTAPVQAQVTNLDASPYLGRLALVRIHHGQLRRGQTLTWCRRDGSQETVRLSELFATHGLERVSIESAGPGEIVAVAGISEITIGETLADLHHPEPLPLIEVDQPSLGMTIGTNTSPLAGRSGSLLTARQINDRLDRELIGNVSLQVIPTDRPDTWEVQGRGEMQLAVLVESMRREGYELTIGKPQVVTKMIDGKIHEPVEQLSIDVPEEWIGVVSQALALRRGRMENMINHGTGWVRLDYMIPARGLVGFRTEFLTETRGTGIIHHIFDHFEPWAGEIRARSQGSLVADRRGMTTAEALFRLQDRGQLFVEPGLEVYEGMIVGENARAGDLDMDATRTKKLNNIRSSTAEELVRLAPPHRMSLDQALEFIAEDECVEVTPEAIRLRKEVLDPGARQKRARRATG